MPGLCAHCRRTIPEVVSYCPYCGAACQRKAPVPLSPLVISLAGVLLLLIGMVTWQLMTGLR
ncbi:MAG: hypothetical protein JWN15_1290 [Firmicutes bacterium]|nr:hypothetical protein [Bacillota bacterium]